MNWYTQPYGGMRGWVEGPTWTPVCCDYCRTVAVREASNCSSCGGPLPIPEVAEVIVEREYRMTREMLDCTRMGDDNRVYTIGVEDARMMETSVRSERVRR